MCEVYLPLVSLHLVWVKSHKLYIYIHGKSKNGSAFSQRLLSPNMDSGRSIVFTFISALAASSDFA